VEDKFRILSIDGGGLRGIIPLQVIRYIELVTGKPIHQSFDLIAGTSTGGLLTCALTLEDKQSVIGDSRKYSLDDIEHIYKERGKEIFPILNGFYQRNKNSFSKWFSPQFSSKNLENVLFEYFGDNMITSCLRPILLTSFDIHRNRPIYFTTREATFIHDKNSKLTEICRASSAAPTYFSSHNFNYDGENITCIDGGIVMNNPSIGALVEVLGNPEYKNYQLDNKQLSLKDITVLSLGTGRSNKLLNSSKSKTWGRLGWIKPIIDISTGGPVKMVDQQIKTIFKASGLQSNYLRIDIDIEEKYSEMSDSKPETMDYLFREANSQILHNHTLLYRLKHFLEGSGLNLVEMENKDKIDNTVSYVKP